MIGNGRKPIIHSHEFDLHSKRLDVFSILSALSAVKSLKHISSAFSEQSVDNKLFFVHSMFKPVFILENVL